MFLRHPHLPLDAAFAGLQDAPVEAAASMVRDRAATNAAVHANIAAANTYAERYANRHRRE